MMIRSKAEYDAACSERQKLQNARAGTPEAERLGELQEALEAWQCTTEGENAATCEQAAAGR